MNKVYLSSTQLTHMLCLDGLGSSGGGSAKIFTWRRQSGHIEENALHAPKKEESARAMSLDKQREQKCWHLKRDNVAFRCLIICHDTLMPGKLWTKF